jgi:hypothetical protein
MGKRVVVAWKNEGNFFQEECDLLDDDDRIVDAFGTPLFIQTEKGFTNRVGGIAGDNDVMFENEKGIFSLPANLIIRIETLEETDG